MKKVYKEKLRYGILLWLFIIVLLSFFDRVNLAIAAPFILKEFKISSTQLGVIMSGFTIGYMLLSFPGGFMVERFSSRKLLSVIIVCWSVMTALTGMAWSFLSLFAIRVIFGMFEGPMFAANARIVSMWMLPRERGLASAMWLAAIPLGALLGNVASAVVVSSLGWRSVFYIFGASGIVIAVLTWFILRDKPEDHPGITREELNSIKEGNIRHDGPDYMEARGSTLAELLKNPRVWILSVLYFCAAMFLWGNLNWLPTYFLKARGFNVMASAIYASLPYLFAIAGVLAVGWLSDHSRKNRCFWLALALFIAGPFTIIGVTSPSLTFCLIGLSAATFFCFGSYAIIYALPMEIFPRGDAAKITGIILAWSSLAGIIAPILVGYVLDKTQSFNYAFYLFAGLVFFAGVLALPLLSSEKAIKAEINERTRTATVVSKG